MHNDASYRTQRRRHGKPPHLNIAEPVKREARLQDGCAIGAENVKVGRVRATQVRGVDRAVGIEHFTMTDGDAVANIPANGQSGPANHVLAKVEGVATGFWDGQVGGRKGFETPGG